MSSVLIGLHLSFVQTRVQYVRPWPILALLPSFAEVSLCGVCDVSLSANVMEALPTCQIWPGCCSRKPLGNSLRRAAGLWKLCRHIVFHDHRQVAHTLQDCHKPLGRCWSLNKVAFCYGHLQLLWSRVLLSKMWRAKLLVATCHQWAGAYVSNGINADVAFCYTNKAFPYLPYLTLMAVKREQMCDGHYLLVFNSI